MSTIQIAQGFIQTNLRKNLKMEAALFVPTSTVSYLHRKYPLHPDLSDKRDLRKEYYSPVTVTELW